MQTVRPVNSEKGPQEKKGRPSKGGRAVDEISHKDWGKETHVRPVKKKKEKGKKKVGANGRDEIGRAYINVEGQPPQNWKPALFV